MPHENLYNYPFDNFIAENAIVGWTQFPTSRPVMGEVIGREIRGTILQPNGELRVIVQSYVKETGNKGPLDMIPNANQNTNGWTDKEYEITNYFSQDYAAKLQYSPTSLLLGLLPETEHLISSPSEEALVLAA